MNKELGAPERRELSPEDIDNLIKLFTAFRKEIRNFETAYHSENQDQEIDYKVYYNRFLIPTHICVDIIYMSAGLLHSAFNLPEWYTCTFSWIEHIFTLEPDSAQDFLTRISFLRTILIPLVLLYLNSIKSPINHNWSNALVNNTSRMIHNAIYARWNERNTWWAIDGADNYFSQKD